MTDTSTGPAPTLRDFGFLSEHELAELRRVETSTLRNERSRGRGPAFTKMGKTVVYPIAAVRDWLAANTVSPDNTPTLSGSRRRRVAA